MTPEGEVKDKIKAYLKSIGAFFYMPVQNGMGKVGIPDFIVCIRGFFVAIEVKAPGKIRNLTANQEARLEEIRTAGGLTLVADDVEQVRVVLKTLLP